MLQMLEELPFYRSTKAQYQNLPADVLMQQPKGRDLQLGYGHDSALELVRPDPTPVILPQGCCCHPHPAGAWQVLG